MSARFMTHLLIFRNLGGLARQLTELTLNNVVKSSLTSQDKHELRMNLVCAYFKLYIYNL